MSGKGDEEKLEVGKTYPLDLAAKISAVKTDGKAPLIIPGPSLRGMRVLTQTTQSSSQATAPGSTIIVPQTAVIKQGEPNRQQITSIINPAQPQVSGSITIQRQAHITLATSLPVVAQNISSGASYHVPRGPAVVANLSAPRSNVAAAIRAPMVVTAQGTTSGTSFVRPPRTSSPVQNTSWLTNTSNGTQIKATPTVLSSPVRGTTITAKPQIVTRPQVGQVVSAIRPTTILQSAIIGQGQIHSFKPGQGTSGIQTLNTTVTLAAQVLPNRTQTLVYSTGNTAHFTSSPRITVSTTATNQRQPITTTTRPLAQVTATRLTVPVNVTQSSARLVAPQATVLTSGARLSSVTNAAQPPTAVLGAAPARIISSSQGNVSLGRLTVTVTNSTSTVANPLLTQIRSTLTMHPVGTTGTSQSRTIQTQGAKVITQSTQGGTAIHLTQMPASNKSNTTVVSTARTISAQPSTALVNPRTGTVVSSHTIPIAKVFPQQDGQVVSPANVFIQTTPVTTVAGRRTSPSPVNLTQATSIATTSSVSTYSIANNAYYYDTAGNFSVGRPFGQQTALAISQTSNQQQRSQSAQLHGIVTNQSMRFNPIMVVEQSRTSCAPLESTQDSLQQAVQNSTKINSSPRPSILRKRDHEGSPLKAAKNLIPTLSNLSTAPPLSPPSRPDSRNNGHSSGGSTTISATSSPGLGDANDDSMQHMPMNKEEEENRPPLEMSPRKKPRKQNLTGNDLDENIDDMQFLSERDLKKEQDDSDCMNSDGGQDGPNDSHLSSVRKPASASLLNSYRHTWKTTNNHYLRYSDVRPKDERRPSIMDLANQHRVLDKVNGWKIYHLSTQMEDLADQEQTVHNQLTELLKYTESKEQNNSDLNRINELIKGNLQRIKIINDGMIEAKSQIMKIFDHKIHVTDIISRCASKRNYKKREKS